MKSAVKLDVDSIHYWGAGKVQSVDVEKKKSAAGQRQLSMLTVIINKKNLKSAVC